MHVWPLASLRVQAWVVRLQNWFEGHIPSLVQVQTPAVQTFPSVQAVPQPPQLFASVMVLTSQPLALAMSQFAKPGAQVTTVHVPIWQVAVVVCGSEHAVPSAFIGFEHNPFAGLHVPALWH